MYIHESIYVWDVGVRTFESQTVKEKEMNLRTNDTHTYIHTYTQAAHMVCKATNWVRVCCIKNLGIV